MFQLSFYAHLTCIAPSEVHFFSTHSCAHQIFLLEILLNLSTSKCKNGMDQRNCRAKMCQFFMSHAFESSIFAHDCNESNTTPTSFPYQLHKPPPPPRTPASLAFYNITKHLLICIKPGHPLNDKNFFINSGVNPRA